MTKEQKLEDALKAVLILVREALAIELSPKSPLESPALKLVLHDSRVPRKCDNPECKPCSHRGERCNHA